MRPNSDSLHSLLLSDARKEMAGLLAILRVAMDRVGSYGPTAPVVKLSLIREAKSGQATR
jgi:hypothetical protein